MVKVGEETNVVVQIGDDTLLDVINKLKEVSEGLFVKGDLEHATSIDQVYDLLEHIMREQYAIPISPLSLL